MARGGQATIVPRKELNHNTKKIPDWAGIKKEDLHQVEIGGTIRTMHTNLLPGDTKLSTKWKSENIVQDKNNSEVKAPIQQILMYCVHAKVRYGYIITQDELVVFRVSEIPRPSQPKPRTTRSVPEEPSLGGSKYMWHLNYKAISWASNGVGSSNDLTINLALWWLHMLAAQERSLKSRYIDLRTEYSKPNPNKNSQLPSFNSTKRGRQDGEDLVGVLPGKRSKRQDPAMSFDSQPSP